MLREIIGLGDGEFLNMDGTFKVAGKVTDASTCLFFIMGDDAKIHGYAAVKSESQEQLFRFLTGYVPFHLVYDTPAAHR